MRFVSVGLGVAVSLAVAEALLWGLGLPERWLDELAPRMSNEPALHTAVPDDRLYAPREGMCEDCPQSPPQAWASSPRRITVNRLGARRLGEGESGALRIVALGGSNTWGAEVSDGETWPDQLELRLAHPSRNVEVWNFGVNGWETRQKVAALRRLQQDFRPDLVLLQLHNLGPRFLVNGQDPAPLAAADPSLMDGWIQGIPEGRLSRFLWDRFATLRFVTILAERRRRTRDVDADRPDTVLSSHRGGLAALQAFRAHEPELPLVLVIPPPGLQSQEIGAMEDFASLGCPLIKLGDRSVPYGEEGQDIHPGARTYRWYAEELARELESLGLLELQRRTPRSGALEGSAQISGASPEP